MQSAKGKADTSSTLAANFLRARKAARERICATSQRHNEALKLTGNESEQSSIDSATRVLQKKDERENMLEKEALSEATVGPVASVEARLAEQKGAMERIRASRKRMLAVTPVTAPGCHIAHAACIGSPAPHVALRASFGRASQQERASAASARSPQPTPSPQQRASPATSTQPSSRADPAAADTPSPAPSRPKTTSSTLPTTSASAVDAPAVAEAEDRHSTRTTRLWADQLAAMERIREALQPPSHVAPPSSRVMLTRWPVAWWGSRQVGADSGAACGLSQAAKRAAVSAASAGAGAPAQAAAKGSAKKSAAQAAVAAAAERVAPNSAFLERFLEGQNTTNARQNVQHRAAASNQSLALTATRAARPVLTLAAKKGSVAAVRRCALSIAEEQRYAVCTGLLQEVAGLFGFDLRARRMGEGEGPEASSPRQRAQTPDGEGEGATPCAKAVVLATLQDAPQGATGSPRADLSPGGSSLGKRKGGAGLRIDTSHGGLDGSSDVPSPSPVFQPRKATRTAPGASTASQSGATRIAKAASVKSRQRPPLAKPPADKGGEGRQVGGKRSMAHAAGAALGKRRAVSLDGGVCAAGLFGAAISSIAKR
ncbi:hypothetical protein CYMTET_27229 [Cymbomonas tetramitiformis]|uniref:Uncharacterized protein n=1 Tax=Cymbomonas tetramitiformis TaxID=36881 RepID=A0AAE0KXE3_9CHLO|nr:hypothetical protein CYMTET_27229 [Cymbomonas tetramitiformis]